MIAVPRSRVPSPRSLRYRAASRARERARQFFVTPAERRRQERFSFDADIYAAPDVRSALLSLFHAKCAFCESHLTSAPVDVVQLRPPQGALGMFGISDPDHYYWLAYEWHNLYPSCGECAQLRGARFPVADDRARKGATLDELASEPALLLDPCSDRPEEHLVFFEDGTVGSDTPRGRATIDAFGLNREPLVERRRTAYALADAETGLIEVADADEFAALLRQVVRERRGEAAERAFAQDEKGAIKRGLEAHQEQLEHASVADDSAREAFFAQARLVERVEIRDFRVIDRLTLELRARGGPEYPWAVLLGENAVGKSTVLQATALALLDAESRDRLGLDASGFVRHGARQATVTVWLTGASTPITLTARPGSPRFEGGSEQKVLVLGYGATRLLPTAAHPAPPGERYSHVDNLFDPFVPVGDTTSWLLGLRGDRFDEVAAALRQLLPLEEGELLLRNPDAGAVEVERDGERVRLEELSAGYQSVIAVATDVIKVLLSLWDTVPAGEAIVIVDELGAHLHPRWRMQIVSSLRTVFPRVQFLVSTHDPLCLRGVRDGEAMVLTRSSDGRVALLDDLPSPESMRVDQLLASEHFGLGSTIDPEVDALFAEYYRLKAKRKPSRADRARIAELKDELDGRQLRGVTRRERLAFDAADEFLAREADAAVEGTRAALKEETRERMAALWSGTAR